MKDKDRKTSIEQGFIPYHRHQNSVKEKGCIHYLPKLPEDSVVLSRKEYEKLKLAKDICCHDLFIATKQSHEEGYKRGYDKGKYEERKETAEKIICIIKTFSYDKEFTKIITRIIAERFGVEIKE